MTEEGVNGLSLAEIARRLGVQPPSIYKYYPSLMAIYDELFRRGQTENLEVMRQAMEGGRAGYGVDNRRARSQRSVVTFAPGSGSVAVLAAGPEI